MNGFFRAAKNIRPVYFNNTLRDFVQSAQGTNSTAEEIVASQAHAALVGWHSIQVTGGTFFSVFTQKGRDEWRENEVLATGFPGMIKTALFRGDCLLDYARNSADLIDATVLEFAKLGINRLSNFHGLNDTRMQAAVGQATLKAQAAGYDIYAQGGICFEDNPNLTLEKAYRAAEELQASGHRDFYLKCANGKAQPDDVYTLVQALKSRFDQAIYLHTHDTYGLAEAIYLAGIEAGADGIDVLPPYLSGNTAQPSALRMLELMKKHPSETVRARVPKLDMGAMMADERAGLAFRFRHRGSETRFNPRLLDAMFRAGIAGGASATLRGVPNLEATLSAALRTKDWDAIQIAIYERQAEILQPLGYPTQVTPYAKLTTELAAKDLMRTEAMRKTTLSELPPDAADYLVGRLGAVPDSVDPVLKAMALKKAGLEEDVPFVPADQLPSRIEQARISLQERGCFDPSGRELITAAMLSNRAKNNFDGVDHVIKKRAGTLVPKKMPEQPSYVNEVATGSNGSHTKKTYEALVAKAMGGATGLEKLAQAALEVQKRGYYKTEIPEKYRPKGSVTNGDSPFAKNRAGKQYLHEFFEKRTVSANLYVQSFILTLPSRLRDAGFSRKQAYAVHKAVEAVIGDVCSAKGVSKSFIPVLEISEFLRAVSAYVPQQRGTLPLPPSEAFSAGTQNGHAVPPQNDPFAAVSEEDAPTPLPPSVS